MNNLFNGMYTDTRNETAEVRAAIYCRLSVDDENEGDSSSIQTQREMLERYCNEHGWEVVAVYQDDGFTGMNMKRPDLSRMLKAVERKQIDVVVTKDLSRLGRNYIQTGQLIEEFFPKNGVRYIAVNDSVDTDSDSSYDMTPFRAVMNQMYSADVSKKIHSAYITKAQSGQFTGCLAPFGYKKHPDNHNLLIPDEDTAWIVKEIFNYAAEGNGPNFIRRRLEDKEIPTPTWWNRHKGLRNKTTKFEREDPEHGRFIWDFTTIKELLQNPVYIGAIASQKQVYKFKTGWIKDKQPNEWLIVEDTHEPIIGKDTFALVQEKTTRRKRPDAFGNYSLFAGMLQCGQCGYTLNIRRANQKGKERIYTCARYNKYGVKHCSQHRIKYDVIYNIVLEQIRMYAAQALEDEQVVIEQLMLQSQSIAEDERALIENQIAVDASRLSSLDMVLGKLYEDHVRGLITEDNFNTLLAKSQNEQEQLRERLNNNTARISLNDRQQGDTSRWLELIKEYADIQELDAPMLNRLIRKIVVHEDFDGDVIRQTVEIHFNFMAQPDKMRLVRE